MDGIREMICRRVQSLRKEAGLTQEQLAERASLSVDAIRKIETLRSTPTLETLEKIGQTLQMRLTDLLRVEDEPTTELRRELEKIHVYLSAKEPRDIRLAQKVLKAVIEEMERSRPG